MLITPPPTTSKRDIRGRNDHRRPERHTIATARCRKWMFVSPRILTVLGQPRRQHTWPTYRNFPLSAGITAGRPARGIPPWCACVRPTLSSGAIGSLTPPLRYLARWIAAAPRIPATTGRSNEVSEGSAHRLPEPAPERLTRSLRAERSSGNPSCVRSDLLGLDASRARLDDGGSAARPIRVPMDRLRGRVSIQDH